MSALHILIVEDNPNLAQQLGDFLAGLGWPIDYAATGQAAVRLASTQTYDVVLLDLNLPDIDGLEVCRQIKAKAGTNVPVLMLTARDAFEDKAHGFKNGADDYLSKPYDMREVVLRCQALSRRQNLHLHHELQVGPLCLYDRELRVTYQDQAIVLTPIGFKILLVLAQQHPNPVTRSALLKQVWGAETPQSDALKSYIYSLRKQLDGLLGRNPLVTLHQVGYQLDFDGHAG